jgi:hypothetical protein
MHPKADLTGLVRNRPGVSGDYTYFEYARFADDLVILIDAYKRHDWLVGAAASGL